MTLLGRLGGWLRRNGPLTAAREAQRRSFAFGNVSIGNPAVTREMVDDAADAMLCEHANESPARCPCGPGCYCKRHTCRGKR